MQQARSDVLRSERLAAIGGLATGIAHEIRNPLTSVKLLLQNAATHPGDALIPQKKLRLILDEVGRGKGQFRGCWIFRVRQRYGASPTIFATHPAPHNLVEGRRIDSWCSAGCRSD